jgi:hypothetical protein
MNLEFYFKQPVCGLSYPTNLDARELIWIHMGSHHFSCYLVRLQTLMIISFM